MAVIEVVVALILGAAAGEIAHRLSRRGGWKVLLPFTALILAGVFVAGRVVGTGADRSLTAFAAGVCLWVVGAAVYRSQRGLRAFP